MKYLRTVKAYTRLDQIRNEDDKKRVGHFPFKRNNNRIQEQMEITSAKNGTCPHSTTGI
jgi:hypothetical protein